MKSGLIPVMVTIFFIVLLQANIYTKC